MATGSSNLSEDQFQCSICLELFTEPVSVPCGHNFCKACISRHWEGKELCKCPLCNQKFSKGLELRVNTTLRDIVEYSKQPQVNAHNDSPIKPGQVPCDCCLGNKFRATKTCLVCLTSYCETHLEPHRRVAALKSHKLTSPVHKLEDKICKKHNRILELFCRKEATRVCVLCTEHSDHDIVPLEEAYVDKGARMATKKAEVQEMKQWRGKKAHKKKAAMQKKTKDRKEASVQIPTWFPIEDPGRSNIHCNAPVNWGFSEGGIQGDPEQMFHIYSFSCCSKCNGRCLLFIPIENNWAQRPQKRVQKMTNVEIFVYSLFLYIFLCLIWEFWMKS